MKEKLTQHFFLRALSLAVMPAAALCDVLLSCGVEAEAIGIDLWWGVLVLMMYPASHESATPSFWFAGAACTIAVVLKCLGAPAGVTVCVGTALLLGFILHKSIVKFAQVPPLFHVAAVWRGVEDYIYLFYVGVCIWVGMMIPLLSSEPWSGWGWTGVLAALYIAQYYRVCKRTTLFLGATKENLIRKTQRGSAFKQPVQYVDSDSRSAKLFNDVVRIMETRKPWLQETFGIEELSRIMRTNRMYLSRSINFHSGRNFNQLTNYYRVRYAMGLITKDPSLRMNEVSRMSGFHTVVSFNMAFKLNERMTPTEFAQSLKKIQ